MSEASLTPGAPTAPASLPSGPPAQASGVRNPTFGPSALATPANAITILRLLATPVLIAMVVAWGANWFTFVVWGVLSFTDGIDGWVARRQGTTRSGAFLDPLADKVVVLGALVALVAKGIVWWVPVAVIAFREIAMSLYRSAAGRRGVSLPARTTAKVKTLLQDAAVALCLVPPLAHHRGVLAVAIWIAAAMTVFTGGQYFLDGRAATRTARSRPPIPDAGAAEPDSAATSPGGPSDAGGALGKPGT